MLSGVQKNCNIHTLLVGMQNDMATLKKFGSFLKVKHRLIIRRNYTP